MKVCEYEGVCVPIYVSYFSRSIGLNEIWCRTSLFPGLTHNLYSKILTVSVI